MNARELIRRVIIRVFVFFVRVIVLAARIALYSIQVYSILRVWYTQVGLLALSRWVTREKYVLVYHIFDFERLEGEEREPTA